MSRHDQALMVSQKSLLPSTETLTTMLSMADALYKSGLLPQHIKSPQAAFAVIQKGIELGIPPMHAMSNIAVIQGKPTANAELMLALIFRDHGDEAMVFSHTDNSKCTISYKRRNWQQPKQYTFSIQDAQKAGLNGGNWTKYPAAMLRARCISAVARLAFPDSIGGMYTAEELGASVQVNGEGEVSLLVGETDSRPSHIAPDGEIIEAEATEVRAEPEMREPEWTETNWREPGFASRILDLEAATGKDIKSLRNKLDATFGTRSPWTLGAGDLERYASYLKSLSEKAMGAGEGAQGGN